jgi:hypothetical protein
MPILIADHRWLAQDDLSDAIANVAYYLANTPVAGQAASGSRTRTVAASGAINTTETLLLATPLLLPHTDFGQTFPGTLNVGTLIRWTIQGTCTDTVANTSTFGVRMGTLGTVAGDTSEVATFVTAVSGSAGTNIPFTSVINLTVQTLGATGTGTGQMVTTSNATGIIGALTVHTIGSASAITALTTTTSTFIDLTMVTAATTTTNTIQSVQCEIFP